MLTEYTIGSGSGNLKMPMPTKQGGPKGRGEEEEMFCRTGVNVVSCSSTHGVTSLSIATKTLNRRKERVSIQNTRLYLHEQRQISTVYNSCLLKGHSISPFVTL